MTEKLKAIRDKIGYASKTESIVKMMKAFSSAKIHEFRASSFALQAYQDVIAHHLTCMQMHGYLSSVQQRKQEGVPYFLVIGSDQGMVGRFNDALVETFLDKAPLVEKSRILVVGSAPASRLTDHSVHKLFAGPLSVERIPLLIGEILDVVVPAGRTEGGGALTVFYNRPIREGLYETDSRRLLPLNPALLLPYTLTQWPKTTVPELIGGGTKAYAEAIVREFLLINLFQMCADSLVAEHETRLASMKEAEKNIEELQGRLKREYNQLRQNQIDQELFDLISGFQTLED